MSRMPPVKPVVKEENIVVQDHKEENIFVEKPTTQTINIDQDRQNLDLVIEPVQKPKRKYKKTSNYMSQKKKEQLARARKRASACKRKQTIEKAQKYLEEEEVSFTSPSIEPEKSKFSIDYERMSELMMDKFEGRMKKREEAQQRARQELAEQERFKKQKEKERMDWEMKIRQDERKKIKGRFGQYTKQYRGNTQSQSGLNGLMRPRGNGGTYGNFW